MSDVVYFRKLSSFKLLRIVLGYTLNLRGPLMLIKLYAYYIVNFLYGAYIVNIYSVSLTLVITPAPISSFPIQELLIVKVHFGSNK